MDITQKHYYNWHFPSDTTLVKLRKRSEQADGVVFDFDIPIADLFSGRPAYDLASSLKLNLVEKNLLLRKYVMENDPHAIFRGYAALSQRLDERGYKWLHNKIQQIVEAIEPKMSEWECLAAERAFPTALYEVVLAHYHEEGKKMAVATNNTPRSAEIFLKREGTVDYFEGIFGRTCADPRELKPNKTIVRRAIKKLNVPPKRCLMFGDSVTDYLAAKKAGIEFIGITYTFDKAVALYQAGADLVISGYCWLLCALEVDYPMYYSDPETPEIIVRT
jgi:HAD superfamily hydrolase (TIGR01549 family)